MTVGFYHSQCDIVIHKQVAAARRLRGLPWVPLRRILILIWYCFDCRVRRKEMEEAAQNLLLCNFCTGPWDTLTDLNRAARAHERSCLAKSKAHCDSAMNGRRRRGPPSVPILRACSQNSSTYLSLWVQEDREGRSDAFVQKWYNPSASNNSNSNQRPVTVTSTPCSPHNTEICLDCNGNYKQHNGHRGLQYISPGEREIQYLSADVCVEIGRTAELHAINSISNTRKFKLM